jgi:WD40 repeat protein
MKRIIVILFCVGNLLYSCVTQNGERLKVAGASDNFPFNIQSPDKRYEMLGNLRQLSGVAAVNDTVIACIGDDRGVVYFYNLSSNNIENKIKFAPKGDFEDISIIADTIYVLDSKGVIWLIKDFRREPVISSAILKIDQPFELEGLCHRKDTLFIAAKYYHNKKRNEVGLLPVWRLKLSGLQIDRVLFDLPDMMQTSEGQAVPFHTSALLFDEIDKQWIFLSTHTKWLVRCSYNGTVISASVLSGQEFLQPEGICFTPSGNLLISNEGRDGKATILLFNNQNNKK